MKEPREISVEFDEDALIYGFIKSQDAINKRVGGRGIIGSSEENLLTIYRNVG